MVSCAAGARLRPRMTGRRQSPRLRATPRSCRRRSGSLRGVVAADHRLFAGIPYAAPPVGALRWRPPAPVAAVERAARRQPRRPRLYPGRRQARSADSDEDCLTLNVWSPRSDGKLPVLVWIHGGAFVAGLGLYDSRRLAARGDVVVVTLNYRLGALGFMAHRALAAEADVAVYGIPDQRAALSGCATTSQPSAAIPPT